MLYDCIVVAFSRSEKKFDFNLVYERKIPLNSVFSKKNSRILTSSYFYKRLTDNNYNDFRLLGGCYAPDTPPVGPALDVPSNE